MKGKDLPLGQYFVERSVTPNIIGRKVANVFVYFSYLKGEQITCEDAKLWDDITIEPIDFPTTLALLIEQAAKDNETVPEIEKNWTSLKTLKNGQWFVSHKNSVGKVFDKIIVYFNDYSPYWGTIESLDFLQVSPITRHQALLQVLNQLVKGN